jgi:hypothetical protein
MNLFDTTWPIPLSLSGRDVFAMTERLWGAETSGLS